MNLDARIEAILFFKGEPVSLKDLGVLLKASDEEITSALLVLEERIAVGGLRLLKKDGEVMLATAPEISGLIEGMIKSDLHKDLGKAGIETLAIVLYLGPVPRSKIDYVRGVNSAFVVRNLMIRGLVEKEQNPNDQRSFLYRPTFELLSYLGVTEARALPEYEDVKREIEGFEARDSEKGVEDGETAAEEAQEQEDTSEWAGERTE
ncbi:MAG: SMC-Scp complex subunit ScpB [Patescibacteria group bacterium]|nr:SMC-Scp complex subunit ScpB [Patescibacteria group bacterium]